MKKSKILICDDSSDLRELFSEILRLEGHEILQSSTGKECLRIAIEASPDLILLDVMLPDISGIEVCRQIKSDRELAGTLVIHVSGIHTSSDNQAEGLEAGADGYLTKPVEPRTLLAHVSALLRIKHKEEQLRESELQFRAAFDNALDAMLIADNDANYIDANPAATALFGVAKKELLGRNVSDFVERGQEFEIGKVWQRFLEGGSQRGEFRLFRPDGTTRELEYSATAHFIPGRHLSVLRDHTERKQIEERLRQSEEFNRAVLSSLTPRIAVLDREGTILAVNDAWENFARLNGGEPERSGVGMNYLEICRRASGDFRANAQEALTGILGVLEGARPNFTLEYPCHAPKEKCWFLMHVTPLLRELGGVVVSHIDISKRKLAEEQTRTSLEEKEVLLREIHHRVKNNLQVISSLLNLQSAYVEDKHALNMFKESQNRIRSMALVHEQLYRSKNLSRIDFADYLRQLTAYMFRLYGVDSNLIKIKLDTSDVSLRIDEAIPCGLIVNELVSNALTHAFPSGREGEIRISLSAGQDGEVTLVVRDNGGGFPKDLDFTKTDSLGIRLVTTLVDQLDGSIKVDGKDGTEIKITFTRRKE